MNQNVDLMLFSAVIISLLVLIDLIVPLVIDRPSFSVTMQLGKMVDQKILSPFIKWVLITWYQWRYEVADQALNYARKEMFLSPALERCFWLEQFRVALKARRHAWNKLCEVRNVH